MSTPDPECPIHRRSPSTRGVIPKLTAAAVCPDVVERLRFSALHTPPRIAQTPPDATD
jgi:hypothetical protein